MNESKDTEHTFARSTDLVLIKPIGSRMEPYTTTDKIAEFAEVSRKAVNQLLRRHLKDLEQFGRWNLKWSLYAEVEQASASKMPT